MAIQLEFDTAKVVQSPTIVLAKKSGKKLGTIPAVSIRFTDNLNSQNVVDFKVNKMNNGDETRLWDEIKNFRLVWCKEWDAWFEITVEIDETNELVKNVTGYAIGESELSVIKIYDTEINTENDIAREDYEVTVLYDEANANASLLDRITEKAPHYTVEYVSPTIANIQRTFTFDNISIYDAFQQIAEEIGCLFYLSQSSDNSGLPQRGIYVYDLEDYCRDCGYRSEYMDVCPECGSTDITDGFGNDSNVFISSENLAEEITLETDTGAVNNCFRLEAGDDLMTAAIMSCNPNGSQYIWHITDDSKSDMSDELVAKLTDYNTLYDYYRNEYTSDLDATLIANYNTLIAKYQEYNEDLEPVSNGTGFNSLINNLYNTVDFELYLTSELMPTPTTSGTTATEQAALLNETSLSSLAVANLDYVSEATVNSNVLNLAKAIVRSTYEVTIKESTFDSTSYEWVGTFTVTNYSDEEDTADSEQITVTVTDNYSTYISQKIDKLLHKNDSTDYDVTGLFEKSITYSDDTLSGDFVDELVKYGLEPLKSFYENCQSCLDILVQEGISDSVTWSSMSPNMYESFYLIYYYKLQALEAEIAVREEEIETIQSLHEAVDNLINDIQLTLDFESYVGETLWKEFCAFRRETTFSNSNYISDGLTNSQIIENAREFLKVAEKELVKSATMQHSISTDLHNLLVIPGFEPFLDHFSVGNWIRVRIDGNIYKLRLISYTIDFDNLDDLQVEFSDVMRCGNDLDDVKSVLEQASSIATSYSYVERQADKGEETATTVNTWFEDGLDVTQTRIINAAEDQTMTLDNHGFLMRKYDDFADRYDNEQVRIVNSTIAITDDNWKTTKTAVGKFFYVDPASGELVTAFGINGETLIGKLIIGETLALYNSDNTMTFNENGLSVTNGTNTFTVNPQATSLMTLLNGDTTIMSVDSDGNLSISGAVTATSGSIGGFTISSTSNTSTTVNEGHCFTNSLFVQTSDTDYEYEAGLKGDTDVDASTFYVKRIALNDSWSNAEYTYYLTNTGSLYCTDADITGAITATSGTIGGFNITSTTNTGTSSQGGHFVTNSLYIHTSDSTYEYEAGLKGESGSPNYIAFYVRRITAGDAWSTGTYMFYVTNLGKLYAYNAEIRGVITATSGTIGGFNITSTANAGTSSNGGHFEANSLYIHTSDSTYEYESGLKGNTGAGTITFYVRRITSGAEWSTGTYMFYVTNLGKLYAYNAEIRGALTATTLATGSKTSASSTGSGIFIDSSGNMYVGSDNMTTITASGSVTAKWFRAYGSSNLTYTTIDDNITLTNANSLISPYFCITRSGTIVAKLSSDILQVGNASLDPDSNGNFTCSGGLDVTYINLDANDVGINVRNGNNSIPVFKYYVSSSGGSLFVGAHTDYDLAIKQTYVRGANVVLHANNGGVYLGSTSGTAVTSDETLKDITDIDDRYSNFFDALNPVTYKYKIGHRTHIGFGAQSVEKALLNSGLTMEEFAGVLIDETDDLDEEMYGLPKGWKEEHDKLYSLRYGEFIALNTYMIKKLQNRIAELEAQLSAM